MTAGFWAALDALIAQNPLVIDRPKGTAHPRYPAFIYPLDYGYLEGTRAMDGGGVDVWRGRAAGGRLSAVAVTVDLLKRDVEIKLLIGCDEADVGAIEQVYAEGASMRGMIVRRPDGS